MIPDEKIYKGVPASPGIIIGSTISLKRESEAVRSERITEIELEIDTFRKAIATVKENLEAMALKILQRLGTEFARIFEAQVMIADDKVWNETIENRIRNERICAEYIYFDEAQKVINRLERSQDAYLKERISDIQAVAMRLVSQMKGEKQATLKYMRGSTVVVAPFLSPGDILALSVRKNLGFCTGTGGLTSHLTLMARSLSIPGVVGLGELVDNIPSSQKIIVDGYSGTVITNPSGKSTRRYRDLRNSEIQLKNQLKMIRSKPAVTKDKKRVRLYSNIELPSEVKALQSAGAEGIGLYRTEYLFLTRAAFPSFDEQFKTYATILKKMRGMPVTIRTYDLGGDKFPEAASRGFELNPFLGWRAIRFCLDKPELFKIQLKALLKASIFGNLSIMIPMISNFEEIIETKRIIAECRTELMSEGVKIKNNIPLGIMLEVPSAVLIARHLAHEVDFFSIGTNDLIQYALAVDRSNEMLSKLYQSFHPSVIELIKRAVDIGHERRIPVSVCGEMAADPLAAILLVGLGVDILSVNAQSVGFIKKVIKSIRYSEAKKMADKVIKMKSNQEVEDYLITEACSLFPEAVPVIQFGERRING